jgi:hypothetical protein
MPDDEVKVVMSVRALGANGVMNKSKIAGLGAFGV